jgi:hypothetical protein
MISLDKLGILHVSIFSNSRVTDNAATANYFLKVISVTRNCQDYVGLAKRRPAHNPW